MAEPVGEPVPTQTADEHQRTNLIVRIANLYAQRHHSQWHVIGDVEPYSLREIILHDATEIVDAIVLPELGLVRAQVLQEACDAVSEYRDEVLGKFDTSEMTQRTLHALANEWITGARSAVFGLAQENKTP